MAFFYRRSIMGTAIALFLSFIVASVVSLDSDFQREVNEEKQRKADFMKCIKTIEIEEVEMCYEKARKRVL